jgi:hypothetical protein
VGAEPLTGAAGEEADMAQEQVHRVGARRTRVVTAGVAGAALTGTIGLTVALTTSGGADTTASAGTSSTSGTSSTTGTTSSTGSTTTVGTADTGSSAHASSGGS